MRFPAISTALGLLLCGCSDYYAEVTGEVNGQGIQDVNTILWGGPFIVLADTDIACMDLAWITRHYTQGESVTDYDFNLLQFAFSDPDVVTGIYNIAGEASVTVKFLSQQDGAFAEYRGRGGNLEIDTVVDEGETVGLFDISFDDGQLSGDFFAEWCRNLKDN